MSRQGATRILNSLDSTREDLTKKPGNSFATFGRLQYIETERITICVGTPLAVHKVCHITFSRDGVFVGDGPPHHFKLDEHGFAVVDPSEVRQDRAWIQFQSRGDHLFGVNIKAEWRRKKAIEANIEPMTGTADLHTTVYAFASSIVTSISRVP